MLAKQDHSSHCCKSLRGFAETVSLKQASTEDTADKYTQTSMCGGPRAKQERCGHKTRTVFVS